MTDFKPHWIRWDEDAFRADRQVNRMTPRQRAMCRNLMIESYYNEVRPYLPADDAQLWQLADADSLEEWLQAKAPILTKFRRVAGDDDVPLLSNKRVMEEWTMLQASLEQKRSAAAKSVAARRQRVRERENLPHTPSENKNQKEKENKSVERPLNERSTSVPEAQSSLSDAKLSENGQPGQAVNADLEWIAGEVAYRKCPVTPVTRQVILNALTAGRKREAILKAVAETMRIMPEREGQPGLFLQQNLPGQITALLEVAPTKAAEEASRRLAERLSDGPTITAKERNAALSDPAYLKLKAGLSKPMAASAAA